jgi:hypothetical protein
MYAEGPEPAIMPASLSCERDDHQKDCRAGHRSPGPMVRRGSIGPPGRPAPRGDDAARSRLADAVVAGVDTGEGVRAAQGGGQPEASGPLPAGRHGSPAG